MSILFLWALVCKFHPSVYAAPWTVLAVAALSPLSLSPLSLDNFIKPWFCALTAFLAFSHIFSFFQELTEIDKSWPWVWTKQLKLTVTSISLQRILRLQWCSGIPPHQIFQLPFCPVIPPHTESYSCNAVVEFLGWIARRLTGDDKGMTWDENGDRFLLGIQRLSSRLVMR